MKLTAQTIRTVTAPDGKSDHIEWDAAMPGFGLRLRGEVKTWVVQYRVGKQQRRESLGRVSRQRQYRLQVEMTIFRLIADLIDIAAGKHTGRLAAKQR